ncbi:MAG: DUF2269 family protein [Chloroflexota bacterium]
MSWLFPWFLFAHILGAIIAFGPTFSSPIIGRMGGREREHSAFAIRVSSRLARVQTLPLAYVQGLTGLGLIVTGNINPFEHGWLLLGITLYAVAIGFALLVQVPLVDRVIAITSGGPPPASAATGGPPAGGPPPELMAMIARVRRGGYLLITLIVSIVFLMVVKPF